MTPDTPLLDQAMPGWAWMLSVLAFAVAMSATPGPNNAMVTASGATFGFRRTVPHMLGVSTGFPLMLVAVAFGLGRALHDHPGAQQALRWVGAAYMLWLAWKIGRAQPGAAGPAGGRPLGYIQAALFQWVNPKAWVIALGAVVTYTTVGAAVPVQAALLAATFVCVTLPILAAWTLVGVGAARMLRTPAARRWFNLAMAGLLVASLAPMLRG